MTEPYNIEQEAALWVMRSEDPEWSVADQAHLHHWLAQSDAHKVAFWRLEYGWQQADRIAAVGAGSAERATRQHRAEHWAKAFAAAASLLLVFSLFGLHLSELPFTSSSGAQTA